MSSDIIIPENATTAPAQEAATPAAGGGDAPPANPLLRRAEYAFAAEDIDREVDRALAEQGRRSKIKGFRPGKAPVSVMRRLHGKAALQQTLIMRAQQRFAEEMQKDQTQERPAGAPHFAPALAAANNNYTVECEYEALPQIEEAKFDGKKIVVPALQVGDKEVDEMTEILRERHGKWEASEDAAGENSRVIANIATFREKADADGEPLEELKNRPLHLADPNLRPDFAAAIKGAKAGDTREVAFELPKDHPEEGLRGAKVCAKITINAVEALRKAELTDAFFAQLGVGEGGLPAFKENTRKYLKREVAIRLKNARQQRAMDSLIECTPEFPLPQMMLYEESVRLLQGARARMGKAAEGLQLASFVPEATRRVRLGLILSAWQKRHKPNISDKAREEKLAEIAEEYEDPEAIKAKLRADKGQMEAVHLSLLEDKVADWVCEQAQTGEEPVTLAQILGRSAGAPAQAAEQAPQQGGEAA